MLTVEWGRGTEERGCTGKVKHWSPEKAFVAAAEMRMRLGVKLRVYRCPFCRAYHIGHVRPRGVSR